VKELYLMIIAYLLLLTSKI